MMRRTVMSEFEHGSKYSFFAGQSVCVPFSFTYFLDSQWNDNDDSRGGNFLFFWELD